jgi:hypothetical protein
VTKVDDWTRWTIIELTTIRTDLWPALLEARFNPVTDPLTAALPPTVEQAERATYDAYQDRAASLAAIRAGRVPPGPTDSPVSEHVLDTIVMAVGLILDLADRISADTGLPHGAFRANVPTQGRGYDDPDQPDGRLHWATLWIEDTLHACTSRALRRHIEKQLEHVEIMIRTTLGQTEHRIRLPYPCPWCGQKGLYLYPADVADDSTVRCLTKGCRPPDEDCGTWLRGQPVWQRYEFEWLAKRIGIPVTDVTA